MSGTTTRAVGALPAVTTLPAGTEALLAVPDGAGGRALRRGPPSAFKGDTGATGATGPAGPQGLQGPQGIQGPAGPAGSGTGTSFTPGRSLSLVSGTLEAGGYYNVRSFGAIGDGTARTLQQMASFRGQSTAGWTLAQWQAVLPHVTALTNQLDWACIQDAARTAKARGGGTLYLPTGGYVMDAANPLSLPGNPIVHLRGDGASSVLLYNADMGTNARGIVCDDAGAIESFLQISHLRIQGNPNNVAAGVKPYQMSAVHLGRAMRLNNCFIRGFFAGAYITDDHQQITFCNIDGCYYNIYYAYAEGQTYGNQYIAFCSLVGCKMAGVGVHWDSGADTIAIYSCHMGFGPYGMYKEAAPAGSTARSFLTNSTLVDVGMESCGNAGIYDENLDANFANNALHNVNIDMNYWGGSYTITSRPVAAAIWVGHFTNNRVTGSQELIVPGDVYARVTAAAIRVNGACAGNDFGKTALGFALSTPAKPYLSSPNDPVNCTWRNNEASGFFSHLVGQNGAVVPAGTVVRTRYGDIHAMPWQVGHPAVGVTAAAAADNDPVPIATRGQIGVRKTSAPVAMEGRLVASFGTPGAIEAYTPATSSPGIGVAAAGAAASDATVSVLLEIANPRHIGGTPTLSYSRATENAAQAQLRGALVAQGLAVDATTA